MNKKDLTIQDLQILKEILSNYKDRFNKEIGNKESNKFLLTDFDYETLVNKLFHITIDVDYKLRYQADTGTNIKIQYSPNHDCSILLKDL